MADLFDTSKSSTVIHINVVDDQWTSSNLQTATEVAIGIKTAGED